MKLENQTVSMSFADLVRATKNDKRNAPHFPYTLEVCRCRYCAYCHHGKCALKHCCCLEERVMARTCTIGEVIHQTFSVLNDKLLNFRLKEAIIQINVRKGCFLDAEHRKRFAEGCALTRRAEPKFIAQIFLLSANAKLWKKAIKVLGKKGFEYYELDITGVSDAEYFYYSAANVYEYSSTRLDLYDLYNDEIVGDEEFQMLCISTAICVYGINVLRLTDSKRDERKE